QSGGELVVGFERQQDVEALHSLALHHDGMDERAAHLLSLGDFTDAMLPAFSSSTNSLYLISASSRRRLEASCTSAIVPTMRSAQNESVRSIRAQLNSRGGGGSRLAIYVRLAI